MRAGKGWNIWYMITSMIQESEASPPVDLSVVLACYNEEPWLERNVSEVVRVLEGAGFSWEIILVDDASRDATPEIVRRLATSGPGGRIRALFHPANTGRGRAVADGMCEARGEVVGFLDVDIEVHPLHIPACYSAVRAGAPVAVGTRTFRVVPGGLYRHFLSWGYSKLVHALLPVREVRDTESGCKFFLRKAILPVLTQVRDPGWFWDTEMMVRCLKAGLAVAEVPCVYQRNPAKGSTVSVARDAFIQVKRILALRKRLARERTEARRSAVHERG